MHDIVCVTWPDGLCSVARVLGCDTHSANPSRLRIAHCVLSFDGLSGPNLPDEAEPGHLSSIAAHTLSVTLLRVLNPANLKQLAETGIKQASESLVEFRARVLHEVKGSVTSRYIKSRFLTQIEGTLAQFEPPRQKSEGTMAESEPPSPCHPEDEQDEEDEEGG